MSTTTTTPESSSSSSNKINRFRAGQLLDWFQSQLHAEATIWGGQQPPHPSRKSTNTTNARRRSTIIIDHCRPPPRIRFDLDQNKTQQTISLEEYSEEELQRSFFQKDALQKIFERSQKIVQQIIENGTDNDKSTTNINIRGLDKLFGERQEACRTLRSKAINAVMDLQEEQWESGQDDFETMASVSREITKEAAVRAFHEARQDVRAARLYLQDVDISQWTLEDDDPVVAKQHSSILKTTRHSTFDRTLTAFLFPERRRGRRDTKDRATSSSTSSSTHDNTQRLATGWKSLPDGKQRSRSIPPVQRERSNRQTRSAAAPMPATPVTTTTNTAVPLTRPRNNRACAATSSGTVNRKPPQRCKSAMAPSTNIPDKQQQQQPLPRTLSPDRSHHSAKSFADGDDDDDKDYSIPLLQTARQQQPLPLRRRRSSGNSITIMIANDATDKRSLSEHHQSAAAAAGSNRPYPMTTRRKQQPNATTALTGGGGDTTTTTILPLQDNSSNPRPALPRRTNSATAATTGGSQQPITGGRGSKSSHSRSNTKLNESDDDTLEARSPPPPPPPLRIRTPESSSDKKRRGPPLRCKSEALAAVTAAPTRDPSNVVKNNPSRTPRPAAVACRKRPEVERQARAPPLRTKSAMVPGAARPRPTKSAIAPAAAPPTIMPSPKLASRRRPPQPNPDDDDDDVLKVRPSRQAPNRTKSLPMRSLLAQRQNQASSESK